MYNTPMCENTMRTFELHFKINFEFLTKNFTSYRV